MPTLFDPTGRILQGFLFTLLLILARVWFLSVIEHDTYEEAAKKPGRRTVIEKRERGTIRDRFNIPLAQNAIQYNACIRYGDIRQIPSIRWEKDENGKRRRIRARSVYIENFSSFLAEKLGLDPQDIEDTIHGNASLFPHTPFVLKEDISEQLYYELKMKEKDWLGLFVERGSKRVYPQKKVGCDLIGYLGAISEWEHKNIAEEIQTLKMFVAARNEGEAALLPKGFNSPDEVEEKLHELQERGYTINDLVGKAGVEASFDQQLRGKVGKQFYEVDSKGNVLRQLPESFPAESGDRLILTISAELQQEAEKLLTEYEALQDARDQLQKKERRHPWQRGGAVVAMDPKTGEIIALASYPRYDPNDLIPAKTKEKRKKQTSEIYHWLESPSHIGEIWDGKRPLERERYSYAEGRFYTEKTFLSWEKYLDTTLPKKSAIRSSIDALDTIEKVVAFQETLKQLAEKANYTSLPALFEALYQRGASIDAELELAIAPFLEPITHPKDKLLLVDLLELVIASEPFSSSLISHLGNQSLSEFRLFSQLSAKILDQIKDRMETTFHQTHFKQWRDQHFSAYLKQKRKEEKEKNRYARPYVEYLQREEKAMFAKFWEDHKLDLLHSYLMNDLEDKPDPLAYDLKNLLIPLSIEDQKSYLLALSPFADLNKPLHGKYASLRHIKEPLRQKHLASAFYPNTGFGYGRSQAFRTATPMGSIFKVVPAYAGLKYKQEQGESDINPLILTDDLQWTARPGSSKQVMGYTENGEPILREYHGGRLPRGYPNQGKLDVVKALERSSNIYFSILAGDVLEKPQQLIEAASSFGLGQKTGIDLPGEYAGKVPFDVVHNKTGLYAFAIGQHSLVATPLQTALLYSAIANGGELLKPQITKLRASEKKISFQEPQSRSKLPLTPEVQETLFEGMKQVVQGSRGFARMSAIRRNFQDPDAYNSYRRIKDEMIGKTGTAEILYKQTIDAESLADLEKHVSFAAISCPQGEEPDLVVVVYLRFGAAGKQGAPIAARLIEKWHELTLLNKSDN